MIHTFYSNAYEGLEAVLTQNLYRDLSGSPDDFSAAFKKAIVVRPSSFIEDRLARSLADHFAITAGVEFVSLFGWLQPKVGATFRSGSIGNAIDWQIWEALNNPDFMARVEALDPPAEKFLNFVRKNREVDGLVELSGQLGRLFSNYASHRIDWVLDWLGDTHYKVRADKQRLLEAQPDYHWQKALWQYMRDNGPSQDMAQLKSIAERVKAITFSREERNTPVHLFMPFSFPPLLLPFIRAYGQKENAPDLWIYILNPSQEYWFDAMPKSVFDWGIKTDSEDAASRYLKSSNASGRAMIDRLYRFLNTDIQEHFETESNLDAPIPAPSAAPRKRAFEHLADLQNPFDADSPLFDTAPEVLACYFDQPNDTYLQKFQNSILALDARKLPDLAQPEDESLFIFKAPSFTREIESLVDWFHYRFRKDPSLKPSDILVMVPDIDTAAAEIEAVMSGLPSELALPWRIYGNSLVDSNLTVNAILDFGRLLTSDFEPKDLTGWLELPVVQERWDLTLADVSALARWLKAAGFRKGLAPRFQRQIDEGRGTLEEALERLTLGFFVASTERRVCLDTLPTFGLEEGGFEEVKDEKGRLLKVLAALYKALSEVADHMARHRASFTAQGWYDTVLSWMTVFFTTRSARQELSEFRLSLYRAVSGMRDGLSAQKEVPFHVFWKFLETQLRETLSRAKPTGTITFASLEACRGAPFRIIVLAGFSESSGFPGRSFHYDFDLMGVDKLQRRADRDAREDNKARFFDALLSARETLVLSYSIGTQAAEEANPSSVIQSFKNYLTCNAEKSERAEILRSLEVVLPLNAFSRKNFERADFDARTWLSPRKATLTALKEAIGEGYSRRLPLFADTELSNAELGCNLEDERMLPAQVLIDFYADPDRFLLKKHRLSDRFEVEEPVFDWVLDTDNALVKKRLQQDWWQQFEAGFSSEEIAKENALNSGLGLSKVVRSSVSDPFIKELIGLRTQFFANVKAGKLFLRDTRITLTVPATVTVESVKKTGKGKSKKEVRESSELSLTATDFTEIVDAVKDGWQDAAGVLYLMQPTFSINDEVRAKIRWLIWRAAGCTAHLLLPHYAVKSDFISQKLASDMIFTLLAIFDLSRRLGVGYTAKEVEAQSVLYRGVDAKVCSKLSKASKELREELRQMFTDPENSPPDEDLYRAMSSAQALLKTVRTAASDLASGAQTSNGLSEGVEK